MVGVMAVLLGDVEFYTGPPVLGAPDDVHAVIVDFLAAATASLRIAVQEIDSEPIARAILDAKARGVRVQVILESSYLHEDRAPADPWAVAGDNEVNRVIHAAFLRAGVDVITDLNPAIFHQKFVVRDHGKASAAVLTGSANFTGTDTGTNTEPAAGRSGNNLNHVVILRPVPACRSGASSTGGREPSAGRRRNRSRRPASSCGRTSRAPACARCTTS
jgi:hypothetical protein